MANSDGRPSLDSCPSATFFDDCDSVELEAIIQCTMGPMVGHPDESNTSYTDTTAYDEDFVDPFERTSPVQKEKQMSFAGWTAQDKTSWACDACTFVNEPLHLTCATCGTAKGLSTAAEEIPPPTARLSHFVEGEAFDPFLEKLHQERHAEVMELQESILSEAALVTSSSSINSNSEPSLYHSCNSVAPAEGTHLHSPTIQRREQPNSMFQNLSDQEARELRKILAMSTGDNDDDDSNSFTITGSSARKPQSQAQADQHNLFNSSTASLPQQRVSRLPAATVPTLSASSNRHQQRRRAPQPDILEQDNADVDGDILLKIAARASGATSTLSASSNRHQQRRRAPQPDILGQDNADVDGDILLKIAARASGATGTDTRTRSPPRCDTQTDMPPLASMSLSTASQPGAFQSRPGAQAMRTPAPPTTTVKPAPTTPNRTPEKAPNGRQLDTTSRQEDSASPTTTTASLDRAFAPIPFLPPVSRSNTRPGATSANNIDEDIMRKIASSSRQETPSMFTSTRKGGDDNEKKLPKIPPPPRTSPRSPKSNKKGALKNAAMGLFKKVSKPKSDKMN